MAALEQLSNYWAIVLAGQAALSISAAAMRSEGRGKRNLSLPEMA
jgi:hypothetical protein